jgi:hypothetical protein
VRSNARYFLIAVTPTTLERRLFNDDRDPY